MRKLAGSAVLILAVTACGGSTSETTTSAAPTATTSPAVATTTTPPGTTTTPTSEYVLFDGSADGFMIALPSRWVPLDPATFDDSLDEAENLFEPEALEFARQGLAASSGASLFAVDVFGTDNVTVMLAPRGPLDTMENIEVLIPAQMAEIGATILSVGRGEYGGAEGLRLIYEISLPEALAAGEQYYVFAEDTIYVITFTSVDPDPPRETFAAVMDTWTLTED